MIIAEKMSSTPDKESLTSQITPAVVGAGRQAFFQSLSQHARLISIETSLGTGALIVERFTGREGMSSLFRFDVDCVGTSASFELKAIVGEEVSLRIMLPNGGSRAIHGVVTRARQLGADGSLTRYSLTLEPWAHSLTLRRDSFVFQDKTALEIVSEVLSDYPLANYLFEVKTALPKRSLTIQYRETDYAFIQRILAEEGLNFYFSHSDATGTSAESGAKHCEAKADHARHQLVVFDDNAHLSASAQPVIRFHRADATEKDDSITRFMRKNMVGANSVSLGSWDYKKVSATSAEDHAQHLGDSPALEIFEGSGAYRFTDTDESTRIARARAESFAVEQQAIHAESSVRALATGTWFSLTGHPNANGEHIVLSIVHEGANNLHASMKEIGSRDAAEAGTYRNQFACIGRNIPVRPAFWHPKPTAPGTQVGVVVGVNSEEITTERDHRIRVQFPWQRGDKSQSGQLSHPTTSNAPGNETAGTWIRVAEPAAGANWGTHFIPRIGQEVCIEFIAGDIDRPVVTGQLYNDTDTPPFHGADNHPGALNGVKSKEYAGSGFNQWVSDDTPAQLRQTASSSYFSSQLNIGYLLKQHGNLRGAFRGTGFELLTDAWGALRAKRGIFISTACRGGATSGQLDALEAKNKLKVTTETAKALSEAAKQHQALPVTTASSLHQFESALTGMEHIDSQGVIKFNEPLTLLDSDAAIGICSPASSVMLAGQDLTLGSASTVRMTAAQTFTTVAANAASLFTHAGGIKAVSTKEPVSVRAHTGQMELLADDAITVTSSNATIRVQAKQEILLASGDGYIKLAGANVDIHCPSSVSVKGVMHDFLGADAQIAIVQPLPNKTHLDVSAMQVGFNEMFHIVDATDSPLPNTRYRINGSNGLKWEGVTDSDGFTQRVFTANQVDLTIEILADEGQQLTQIVE